MNDLMNFDYGDKPVRGMLDENGSPILVAKDVCGALELTNPSVSVQQLDEDERAKRNLGRQGETWFVTESGLYTLIIRSNKPEAKRFRRWITHEVLPSIRRTGGYAVPGRSRVSARLAEIKDMANAAGLKPTQRIRLLDIARHLTQMDVEAQDDVLDLYGELCTAVGPGRRGDPVRGFVEACCALEGGAEADKGALYEAYRTWAAENGQRPLGRAEVFRRLYAYPGVGRARPRRHGGRERVVTGIRLRAACSTFSVS